MKLSSLAVAAAACAFCVTPIAHAQETYEPTEAAEAAPSLSSGLQPVSHVEGRYPGRELREHTEGECTVLFDVESTGSVANVRTESCTSRGFAREARRIAANLHYPAEALPAEGLRDQSFKIRWEGEAGEAS
ncbi:MAG: TonB family protein [Maricaulaceae bacterium]|jgi:TonB family protein